MKFDLSLVQEQSLRISPMQIQSLQLLAMDNNELQAFLEKEYLENPLIEHSRSTRKSQSDFEETSSILNQVVDTSFSIEEYVCSQLDSRNYSESRWRFIRYLANCLSPQGFFEGDLTVESKRFGIPADEAQVILNQLQQLEPTGIFARDVKQCLLLQLGNDPDPLVRQLITDHLDSLGSGEIGHTARLLHIPPQQIRRALARIAELKPYPLNGFDNHRTHYIVPDILLEYDAENDRFHASINDAWYEDYTICDYYVKMISTTSDPEVRAYFESRYQRARSLLSAVLSRRQTLITLVEYLVARQREYILGTGNKQSVTMTDAATALKVTVSTISRAVKGKYLQCPERCIPLRELFEIPVTTADAEKHCSRQSIKQALKQLIVNEDKSIPLSDAQLSHKLTQMGFSISRRTVAKYRESLSIPGCFDRRIY